MNSKMKILFVATRKNADPTHRELYEMTYMTQLLRFKRSLLDLGILTVAACTPPEFDCQIVDEYVEPIPYDTDAEKSPAHHTQCRLFGHDPNPYSRLA